MQRFLIILDDSITPNAASQLAIDIHAADAPYPWWLYIVPISSQWTSMNDSRDDIKSSFHSFSTGRSPLNIQYDLTPLSQQIHSLCIEKPLLCNDHCPQHRASSLTLSASAIHSACSQIQQHLQSNPQSVFSLDLIWKFPTFSPSDNTSPEMLHDGLLSIYGAVERVIQYNLGHIHIVHSECSAAPISVDGASDLFALGLWTDMFSEHVSLWNMHDIPSQSTFSQIARRIINPLKLCSITLTVTHNDTDKQQLTTSAPTTSEQPINNQSHSFTFDLFPSALYDHHTDSYLKSNTKTKWQSPYQWSTMHLLQTIRRRNFPRHLLVSDHKIIGLSPHEPTVMIIAATNHNATSLCNEWVRLFDLNGNDHGDISWIVQFSNVHSNNHSKRHKVEELKENAFQYEEDWIRKVYLNEKQQAHSNSSNKMESDSDGDIDIKEQYQNAVDCEMSSQYLLFPVHREAGIMLVAHRILNDKRINGVVNMEQDWIHSLLHLTYKSTAQNAGHSQDIGCNLDIARSLSELPNLRYDSKTGKLVNLEVDRMDTDDDHKEMPTNQRMTVGDEVMFHFHPQRDSAKFDGNNSLYFYSDHIMERGQRDLSIHWPDEVQ